MASFEVYRRSTIGMCLTETLDQMVSSGVLAPELAIQVLIQFDKSMTETLESEVKSKVSFKGHLHTYGYVDDVWTLVLKNVQLKSEGGQETVDVVKIVACDSTLLTNSNEASTKNLDGHGNRHRFARKPNESRTPAPFSVCPASCTPVSSRIQISGPTRNTSSTDCSVNESVTAAALSSQNWGNQRRKAPILLIQLLLLQVDFGGGAGLAAFAGGDECNAGGLVGELRRVVVLEEGLDWDGGDGNLGFWVVLDGSDVAATRVFIDLLRSF
ncbi:Transcription initiation factor IIA subunit 2 [Striga hermonthica]|uniref:Transcription initiation factor IIA subunit 2 n=1 Tax=Striga hermonthica TaxID=68872 RepID=A0A9N7NFR8_STRHE|nr:Transcription initiation factor IIA subunit 2 [Striga hermonthica]